MKESGNKMTGKAGPEVAVYVSGLLAVVLIFLGIYSAFVDFTELNYGSLLLDFILILVGGVILQGALEAKKQLKRNEILEEGFNELFMERMEPVVKQALGYQVEIENLEKNIERMDKKIDHIAKRTTGVVPGVASEGFFQKKIFMSIITLGTILFINLNINQMGAYLILALFAVWWWVITSQFELFDDVNAYVFIIFPMLAVPLLSIVLVSILNVFYMLMSLYFLLVLYVIAYYYVAKYQARGIPVERKVESEGG